MWYVVYRMWGMRHFTFRREARWLVLLTVLPPAIAMFAVLVWPTIARWFGR